MKRPRFEVVRTDAGWHARFVAANGRIVWTTEVYRRRIDAFGAISLMAGPKHEHHAEAFPTLVPGAHVYLVDGCVEIREVDERPEGNATNGGPVLVVGSDG